MTQEEKAKAYDEALERMKSWVRGEHPECFTEAQKAAEFIFPELKESEDERIRKALVEFLKRFTCVDILEDNGVSVEDAITWLKKQGETENEDDTDFTIYHPLKNGSGKYECIPYSFYGSLASFSEDEDLINFLRNCFYTEKECKEWIEKQGEQKLADKIKPKFNVGDWVVRKDGENFSNGCKFAQITNIDEEKYWFDIGTWLEKEEIRLWAIQDAKDGDVLAGSKNNVILMFRGIGNTEWNDVIDYHCYYDCYRKDFIVQEDVKYWGNIENNQLKPATKEQRELLFQKMKEAGYEFNFTTKELKKI